MSWPLSSGTSGGWSLVIGTSGPKLGVLVSSCKNSLAVWMYIEYIE